MSIELPGAVVDFLGMIGVNWPEVNEDAVIAAANEIVKYLENQLIQHIMGEVIGKVVEPLEAVVEKAVSGLSYAATLDGHTDAVAGHAQDFIAKAGSVSFA